MATGLQQPQIDTMEQFAQGVNARQTSQNNQIELARKGMENIGAIALGSMGGKLDGPVDPEKFKQGLDLLEQNGVDVSSFRDHPEIAPVAARASMSTLQQLAQAQNEEDAKLALEKFGLEMQKAKDAKASGGYDSPEKFSLNPTYYKVKGPDGKDQVLFGTMGDRGTFKPVPLPEGGTPAVPVQQLNTETGFVPVNKFGDAMPDAPVTTINNAEAAHDTAVGKGTGEAEVAKPMLQSKARSALNALDSQTNLVGDTIDTVITQVTTNPALTTGTVGDWSKAVAGTPAYDVYQNLLSIKANIGFDKLAEMRANSPTGGALGSVSDYEGELLQAVNGALAQGQSKDQLVKNLQRVKDLQAKVRDEQHKRFQKDFGGGSAAAPAPSGTVAPAVGGEGDVIDWTDPSLGWDQ